MDEAGLLHRTHGGALPVALRQATHEASIADKATHEASIADKATHEASIADKAALCAKEKRVIGLTAARLVTPGDTLALNGGTTTIQVARALRGALSLHI